MKITSPLPTAICVAALILFGVPSSAPAKDKKTESASLEASAAPPTKAKAMPYRGTIGSVDAIAKIFTVGKRTIKVTDQTKITKHGAAATMADIAIGEKVGGSYWKNDDGVLEARNVKIGTKIERAKPMTEEASPTASP